MSNLKKILAIVLAVTMVMALGITAGAADAFPDVKAGDPHARAINLLASLEVLKGFEDGTYQPDGTYTREQFAKILYVLMHGKDDNAAMYTGTSPFPDVEADRWSAGYITWAKNSNIINGREDGLFWPTDIVTYAEAAKMFVIAMGYDSTVYTFPYGFIDKAQTLKLFDDIAGMTANGPAKRGTIAQMAFNCLFAEAPRFGTYAAQIGNSSTTETKTKTVAMGAFGMMEATAILRGTSTYALDEAFTDYNQVSLSHVSGYWGDNYPNYLSDGIYDYEGKADANVGSKVVIWFREAKSATGTGADSKAKIFDIQPTTSNKVYEFPVTDVKKAKTTNDKLVFAFNGSEKTLKWDFEAYDAIQSNGKEVTDLESILKRVNESSSKIRAIDFENDGTVDYFIVTKASTSKISTLTSTRITFGVTAPVPANTTVVGAGTKNIKDGDVTVFNIADGVEAGKYAVTTSYKAYTEKGMLELFDVVKAVALDNAKLNDTEGGYRLNDTVYYEAPELADSFLAVAIVGNRYDVVLNANGDIVFSTKTASAVNKDKWILITDSVITTSGAGGGTSRVSSVIGYSADGKKATYAVPTSLKVDGVTVANLNAASAPAYLEQIFQFTVNSAGEITALKTLDKLADENDGYAVIASVGTTEFVSKTSSLKVSGGNVYLEDDAVIYFYDSDDEKYSVVSASELKSFDTGIDAEQILADGRDGIVLLMTGTKKPIKSTDKLGLVLSASKRATDDDEYIYTFRIAYDGKINTVSTDAIDDDTDYNALAAKTRSDETTLGFCTVELNSNGKVTGLTPLAATAFDHIAVTQTKTSSITGTIIKASDIVASTAPNSDCDFGLGVTMTALDTANGSNLIDAFAKDIYYYIVSDYPVVDLSANIGIVDFDPSDSSVEAVPSYSIAKSNDSSISIVTIIYNDDDEIESIYIYLNAIDAFVAP